VYNHDDFVKLLNNLPDWFVAKTVSFGQSAKIVAGNAQEPIVEELFNRLGLPGIRATCGEKIDNTTRSGKTSHVDVTVWHNDKPIIAIDVKNGGSNGTESAGARANDVEARVAGAAKKGYLFYFYLFTPQTACTSLDHVDIAMQRLTASSTPCKLLTACIKKGDTNLQILCDVITQQTGQHVDTSMIIDMYNVINKQPSLKDRIRSRSEHAHREELAVQAKSAVRLAKAAKIAARKR